MFSNKRHRTNSAFDQDDNPLPQHLKESLSLVSNNFFNSRMRNLEIMNTRENRLFALMTHYDGHNFCWIQPTRVKNMAPSIEYSRYMKLVLNTLKFDRLKPLPEIRKGTECLACYDADRRWYRAIVVEEADEDFYLVLFIDYGNLQRTRSGYLAALVSEPGNTFYDAPVQAVCCRLYNIIPRLPSARDQIDRHLEQSFTQNPNQFYEVVVRNVRSDFAVDVDLFRIQDGATGSNRLYRTHIGQELVDSGLATFACPKAAYSVKASNPKME